MEEPDGLFARAGALLGTAAPRDAVRDAEHARHLRNALTVEQRRLAHRAGTRRTVWRVASGAGLVVALLAGVRYFGGGQAPGASRGANEVMFSVRVADARHVSLVGEFNGWDSRSTPMTRSEDGLWQVRLRIPPGRHTYAFVVNDSTWIADPAAARAPQRWSDDPRSVLVVAMAP